MIDKDAGRVAIESTQLLTCPFCGMPPEMLETPALGYSEVYCANRECVAKPTAVSRYIPDAVARWNTRDVRSNAQISGDSPLNLIVSNEEAK